MATNITFDGKGNIVDSVEVPDEPVEPTEVELLRAKVDQLTAEAAKRDALLIAKTDITAEDLARVKAAVKGDEPAEARIAELEAEQS